MEQEGLMSPSASGCRDLVFTHEPPVWFLLPRYMEKKNKKFDPGVHPPQAGQECPQVGPLPLAISIFLEQLSLYIGPPFPSSQDKRK